MAGRPRRQSGAPPQAVERAGAPSARQTEILRLVAQGRSNREIARQLGLTEGTVKQHLYTLYRKLGVRNRTQALREGARWLGVLPAPVSPPAKAPRATMFARRLVTTVVLLPRPEAASPVSGASILEDALAASRDAIEALALAFDATPEPVSGGGLAVWFGRPLAHGDDVARAVAFARSLGEAGLDASPAPWTAGIATAAEVLGEDGPGTPTYRTLRIATLLATLAQPGAPLACGVTAAIEPGLSPGPGKSTLPEGAVPVDLETRPPASVAQQWGGLPFCGDLVAAAQRRRVQWLAVESWPPEAGTRLLTAIGAFLAARGLLVRTLWAPARSRISTALSALLGQLNPGAIGSFRPTPESLAEALLRLPQDRPAIVVVHGMDALAILESVLGEGGLRALRESPLIIAAGAMQMADGVRTTVRLLGSSPVDSPFVRVLRMQVPPDPGRLDLGVRADVQALLDSVSVPARQVARAASRPEHGTLEAVARDLAMSLDEVRERCHELGRHGLLRLDGDALVFRDEITAAAVRASLA